MKQIKKGGEMKEYDHHNKDPHSGDPECDRNGYLYHNNPPRHQTRRSCKECENMLSGRCGTCGRNIFGKSEYMDHEL